MPIRIQRVAPDTGQVALQPAVRATPEAFGADIGRAGYAAGVALQRAGLQGLDRLIEIKQAQDEEDARLDLAQQAGAFKLAVAQREPEIRSQTDAKDYPAAMAAEIDRQAEDATQRLRYPQLAARFRAGLAHTVAAEKIQALHAGIKLQNNQIEALAGIQQAEDANAAVFAPTDGERAAALERGFTRIQGLVNRGVYSGEQGKAATTAFLGAIERGGIRRDFQNPELRAQVIDTAMGGGYKYIPAAEQINLATAMIQRQEADQRRLDAQAERGAKKLKDDALSDLFARAMDKTLTVEQFKRAVADFRLSPAEQRAIADEMERDPKESKAPSDPATLERVVADTHSQYPKLTEKELLALKQSGALNQKDYQSALDRLRETREGLEAKGRTELHDRHGQAEQSLRAALGIPTMWEKLDPASKKAWNLAMQELTRRSAAYNGKEDPLAVADSMIPRYSKMLDQSATVTADQARAVLKYPTPAALEAARGTMSQAEYDAQRQLFLAIDKENIQRAGRKLQEDLQKALGKKKGATTTAPRPD